jgi:hypothetical protein
VRSEVLTGRDGGRTHRCFDSTSRRPSRSAHHATITFSARRDETIPTLRRVEAKPRRKPTGGAEIAATLMGTTHACAAIETVPFAFLELFVLSEVASYVKYGTGPASRPKRKHVPKPLAQWRTGGAFQCAQWQPCCSRGIRAAAPANPSSSCKPPNRASDCPRAAVSSCHQRGCIIHITRSHCDWQWLAGAMAGSTSDYGPTRDLFPVM